MAAQPESVAQAGTDNPGGAPAKTSSARGKPKGWRKWLYRLAALTVVPTLLFGLLELGFSIAGYGYPTSFFIPGAGPEQGTVVTENRHFGRRFFPPGLARRPLPVAMPKIKPEGTYRIFVFGESAALGFPRPATSFARILLMMLREAYPETRFEIINTAVPAINSHVVRLIAAECAERQPDLFIVYMGNNEVIGPFGAAGVIGAHAPNRHLIRANLAVRRTRTGQMLGNLVGRLRSSSGPREWEGMAMFLESQIGADDPRLAGTYDSFRANLLDICQAGTQSGSTVLACTVAVNLKDCAPFGSLHAPDLSTEQLAAWERAYKAGVSLEEDGRIADALRKYADAVHIDERFADLQFRMGRCFARLGQVEEARQKFILARDLDTLRFRADTKINATIREVAGETAGVQLVDVAQAVAADSAFGVPGEDLFLEHVHLNFAGNYVVARALFQQIVERDFLGARRGRGAAARLPLLTQRQCAERLGYFEWDGTALETFIRPLLREPPFTLQLDHVERDKRWDALLEKMRSQRTPAAMQAAAAVYRKAIHDDPDDWMLRDNFAKLLIDSGDARAAVAQLQWVVSLIPHDCEVHVTLGTLLFNTGNLSGAEASFEKAIKLDPEYADAHYRLAKLLAAKGYKQTAIARYAEGVKHVPNRAEGQAAYAGFLLELGMVEEARERLQDAFAINPDHAVAHMVMGNLLAEQGQTADAIGHYEAALRSRPSLWSSVNPLLAKLRKPKPADPNTPRGK